ncbi:E3 ubiquitin-protein ligase JMJ24 [Rutidosis leptorrhynchoides]|uniref:E3 ubiquitin-protein ligase JMJ24 n=1 Tax=Rutidosis leptorrhynchoides TaxID=125765 RepID=UPI003A99E6F1
MDLARPNSETAEENTGIPDDLRCKRSDGKQWRCHAMSMPDKTVCEKHYIQAKKRAANSAMRASLKKAKRKHAGESDSYLESKSDDMDSPIMEYRGSGSGDKNKDKISKKQISYSPETPSFKNSSVYVSSKSNDELQRDTAESGETPKAFMTPSSVADSSKSRSDKMHSASAMTETSDGSSESCEETGGQVCHQCRRDDIQNVVWCLKCDRRGYCNECISTWYPDISAEEIHRVCPACRGCCNCKMCLRGDNMIKGKIRDIHSQEKLEHLFVLLSSVLPVIKQVHSEQCSELELERKFRGNRIDLPRTKLNADEQMCCDFCRIPIIDYHRHCGNCLYDICLRCCQDVRKTSKDGGEVDVCNVEADDSNEATNTLDKQKMRLSDKLRDWKSNTDGSVPCPPKKHGGCGNSPLILKRIFKMNWVAKLVKNVDEMVSGCKMYDINLSKNSDDDILYAPSCKEIKCEGIDEFRKRWVKGQPVTVRGVSDESSMLGWDPMVMWKGIQETSDERKKDVNRLVKAINCFDRSEINIELGEFIRGYSEGRMRKDGQREMLILKNWPSPSASEEFLSCQRPEFISKLPLIEYIHSKWGLLNLPAKLPHYSLQNDVGPKILISYGAYDEFGQGDSVHMLRFNMRDVVYLLVHKCELKTTSSANTPKNLDEPLLPVSPNTELNTENDMEINVDIVENDKTENQGTCGMSNEKAPNNLDEPILRTSSTTELNTDDDVATNLDTVEEDKTVIQGFCGASNEKADNNLNRTLPTSPITKLNSENNMEINMDTVVEDKIRSQGICGTGIENALKDSDEPTSPITEVTMVNDVAINVNSVEEAPKNLDEATLPKPENDMDIDIDTAEGDKAESKGICTTNIEKPLKCEDLNDVCDETFTKNRPGAIWDIFRREDVPKLIEYMKLHRNEFGFHDDIILDSVPQPLHEGTIFITSHHKSKLKEEFGIEPWSIEQYLGDAVFIPTGCPFQVRNLQSSVQLGFDFLFPESLAEAVRLAGEIRELPNDHDAKLQILETGKISLYAASSSIKEVQKLVLDPKLEGEIAFEDPNLTNLVQLNLEKITKQRQVVSA